MSITSKNYPVTATASVLLEQSSVRLCTVVQNRGTAEAVLLVSDDGETAPNMAAGITLAVNEKFIFPVPVGNFLWAEGSGDLVIVTNNQE